MLVRASEQLFGPAAQTLCALMNGSWQLIVHAVCGD